MKELRNSLLFWSRIRNVDNQFRLKMMFSVLDRMLLINESESFKQQTESYKLKLLEILSE